MIEENGTSFPLAKRLRQLFLNPNSISWNGGRGKEQLNLKCYSLWKITEIKRAIIPKITTDPYQNLPRESLVISQPKIAILLTKIFQITDHLQQIENNRGMSPIAASPN